MQPVEVGQAAQLGRDRPCPVGAPEQQLLQVGKLAHPGWDRPCHQVVGAEIQGPQVGQAAQLGRDRPGQRVAAETQLEDPAIAVRRDSVPVAQGRRRLPVRVVGPARSAGRVVERLEGDPVRRSAPLGGGTRRPARPERNDGDNPQRRQKSAAPAARSSHVGGDFGHEPRPLLKRTRPAVLPQVNAIPHYPTQGDGSGAPEGLS